MPLKGQNITSGSLIFLPPSQDSLQLEKKKCDLPSTRCYAVCYGN